MIKLTAKNYKNVIQFTYAEIGQSIHATFKCCSTKPLAFESKICRAMKETWLQMKEEGVKGTLDNWETYYKIVTHNPEALIEAGKKTYAMITAMNIGGIDEEMCIDYIKEVVTINVWVWAVKKWQLKLLLTIITYRIGLAMQKKKAKELTHGLATCCTSKA